MYESITTIKGKEDKYCKEIETLKNDNLAQASTYQMLTKEIN